MLNEGAFEGAAQDVLFSLDEDLHALLLETVDDAGTEIYNLLVHVVYKLRHALLDVLLLLW